MPDLITIILFLGLAYVSHICYLVSLALKRRAMPATADGFLVAAKVLMVACPFTVVFVYTLAVTGFGPLHGPESFLLLGAIFAWSLFMTFTKR